MDSLKIAGVSLVATLAFAACSSGSNDGGGGGVNDPGSDDPAATLLAGDDGSSDIAAYSAALDRWQAKCREGRTKLAGMVDFAYRDLAKNGVAEGSRLAVMQHLTTSVPAGAAPTNCGNITAAYLVLREK